MYCISISILCQFSEIFVRFLACTMCASVPNSFESKQTTIIVHLAAENELKKLIASILYSSRFRDLLDNEELLDQFLDREEFCTDVKKEVRKESEIVDRDPESSFLRISCHLRQALKKHLPWVNLHPSILSISRFISILYDTLSIMSNCPIIDIVNIRICLFRQFLPICRFCLFRLLLL